MNITEVHLMIFGVIAAAFNGGIQPAFAIIFSRVLRVRHSDMFLEMIHYLYMIIIIFNKQAIVCVDVVIKLS